MTLLDIRGLNVYYGESHILRDVDLNVAAGEMVCLIGRNGVGKTTLLKTVIGLLQQRSGDLQLEGRELTPCLLDAALLQKLLPLVHHLELEGHQVDTIIFVNVFILSGRREGILVSNRLTTWAAAVIASL